jgi:hypothetical protein
LEDDGTSATRTNPVTDTPSATRPDTEDSPTAESSTTEQSPPGVDDVTDYEAFSREAKEFFRRLVETESVIRPSDRIPEAIWEAKYVRYDGEIYAIRKSHTGRNVAEYVLELNEAAVESPDSLIEYTELDTNAKQVVDTAISEGRYVSRGTGLPETITDSEYLQFEGTIYEIVVIVGDIRVWRLSVEDV